MTQEEKTIIEQKLECVAILFRSTIKNNLPDVKDSCFLMFNPGTGNININITGQHGYQMVLEGAPYQDELGEKIHWNDRTDRWNHIHNAANYDRNLKEAKSDGFTTGYATANEGGVTYGQ